MTTLALPAFMYRASATRSPSVATALTLPQAYAFARLRWPSTSASAFTCCPDRSFTTSSPFLRAGGGNSKRKAAGPSRSSTRSSAPGGSRRTSGRFVPRAGPLSVPDYSLPKPASEEHIKQFLYKSLDKFATDSYLTNRLERLGLAGEPLTEIVKDVAGGKDGSSPVATPLDTLIRQWTSIRRKEISNAKLQTTSDPPSTSSSLLSDAAAALAGVAHSTELASSQMSALTRLHVRAFLLYVRQRLDIIIGSSDSSQDLVRSSTSLATLLDEFRSVTSLTRPHLMYPAARTMRRQIHLHIGPTNSGKTHSALVKLCRARSGVYLGPLRLLAHEVWERINNGKIADDIPPRACNLVTGEEMQPVEDPRLGFASTGLTASTVEMFELHIPLDVLVIDEIQMIADEQRGYAWTQALLCAQAREIHLCGEASVMPLIKAIAEDCGDEIIVHDYQRLTPLRVAEESLHGDLSKVRPGDCVVAFSRAGIFAVKSKIEQLSQQSGKPPLKCAVAYGSLPPEVKAQQARLFNEGIEANVMVASDAIGMGLNLRINRIILETTRKWNGQELVSMSASQIKQIAGRAGRYGKERKGKAAAEGGVVCTLQEEDMPILRAALDSPMRYIHHAAIQPPKDRMEVLSTMLPPTPLIAPAKKGGEGRLGNASRDTRLALDETEEAVKNDDKSIRFSKASTSIYSDIALFGDVDTQHYFLSPFRQQYDLGQLVKEASSLGNLLESSTAPKSLLTWQEQQTFCNAPVQSRDPSVTSTFKAMVSAYTRGDLVDIEGMMRDEGLLDALLDAESVMEAMHSKWTSLSQSTSSASPPSNPGSIVELASLLPATSPFAPTTLMALESLHRAMGLYLWLSSRNPSAFCFATVARKYKFRAEKAIEFVLQGMKVGRSKRLQLLGRDPDNPKDKSRRSGGGWKAERWMNEDGGNRSPMYRRNGNFDEPNEARGESYPRSKTRLGNRDGDDSRRRPGVDHSSRYKGHKGARDPLAFSPHELSGW